jgi:hypothetical protein
MNQSVYLDLFKIGLKPIPLIWSATERVAKSHVIEHSTITAESYNESNYQTFLPANHKEKEVNGIGLKLFPPFGMIDFDLKNTSNKSLYTQWVKAVSSIDDDILSKVCIEKTRNNGFHVYIKYKGLTSKSSLAREENGEECIAIYTGGVLSYCAPTPGYEITHNSFTDIEELTADEFDILTSCAISFNKYEEKYTQTSNLLITYPLEYETQCLLFDRNITDEAFTQLINDMGLYAADNYHYKPKDKFTAFLRRGSKAVYSAKVYYGTKNLQLFTSSIAGYPHFQDRVSKDDTAWNLSPSRIIYYKNDRDWTATLEEIKLICDSIGIEVVQNQPITNQSIILPERLKFPYDIFPDEILNFINANHIQHEYLAGAALGVVSTMIGNSATLLANGNYFVKPILYMAIVAPPGASKTPALKAMFSNLEACDAHYYAEFLKEKKEYREQTAAYKNQQKGGSLKEPLPPKLQQFLIKDSTIEMVIKILSYNPDGCCILADELSGFLKRFNRYGENDEVQKWLELWSGSPVLMQRISRDEDKVQKPFCSIIGGIQPGVLESLSSQDNEHNGFYHRFLFVYPEPQKKPDWNYYEIPAPIITDLENYYQKLFNARAYNRTYKLTTDANLMYAEWFNYKNRKYNHATQDNVKGVIAKYQDYCLRFALIIQYMHDGDIYNLWVSKTSVERAIRLTEYFLGNMHKSMKILAPVTPVDKLQDNKLEYYRALPDSFTPAKAISISETFGIKSDYCRVLLNRWSQGNDKILTKTGDTKNTIYDKIFV